jgi:methylated-DNA-[protein]-cysteine S-methyltransferase
MSSELRKHYFKSPIGWLELGVESDKLVFLKFQDGSDDYLESQNPSRFCRECINQLSDYFEGKSMQIELPVKLVGTDFQQQVWTELRKIPYGETISYETLSKRIGNLKAIRAVATANGSNPLHLLIPCHRVIGKNGQLTGYAGGLWRKQWLLEHEAKISGRGLFLFD